MLGAAYLDLWCLRLCVHYSCDVWGGVCRTKVFGAVVFGPVVFGAMVFTAVCRAAEL